MPPVQNASALSRLARRSVVRHAAGMVALLAAACQRDVRPHDVLAAYDESASYGRLTIDYPLDETVFPPEIVAPTFRWTDSNPAADTWVVSLRFADGGAPMSFLAHAAEWTPRADDWDAIKRRSLEKPARVLVLGVDRRVPGTILSAAQISISTSRDEVGAPIFYREVNLPFIEAVKDPSRIRWRFGPISSPHQPPVVLENLPVCGNCHSFSADGRTLGMDVDYANDKGSYAIAAVQPQIELSPREIITWADYRRDDGEDTFGLLSQVSPDGRYVISTVKDRSVFVPRDDLAFSQLFFPIKGILVVYDRQTKQFCALPGADDPAYVQSNPTWSPDGGTIVFARSPAYRLRKDKGNVLLGQDECAEFLEEGQSFLFDLYRVPFNEGQGGEPEPIAGASADGMSNYFAKFSPDGRWIVFCKARSYMLLQPDSELYIIPAAGGQPRRLRANTGRMNSWHSWSPNGRWLVFSSKVNSPYTQLFLTHIDEQGESTPPVLLAQFTAPDRAANIPEFVNARPEALLRIRERFIDDVSYVRAGDMYLAANDVAGAIAQYRKALELNADNAVAHSNLGGLLSTEGQFEEAERHLRTALRLDPQSGAAHFNLGVMLFRLGKAAEAARHLSEAVRLKPQHATAQRTLGVLLVNQGMPEQALVHLREAVRLEPENATAHFCLGKALVAQGDIDQAVQHLTTAVRLEPDYATARCLLGQVLYRAGRTAEAISQLSLAVNSRPDDPDLLRELAWVLATAPQPDLRDAGRAIQFARRACALTGYRAIEPLDTLGVCHAAAGQFDEAVRAAEQALRLAQASGQEVIARLIAQRVELYRQGRAYVPPGPP